MPYITSPTSPPPSQQMPPPTSTTPSHIRTKNKRKLYLDANPSYFTSPDLELADPLLYDACIRKFQSPSEREADGKRKGYSGVLEADLWRSEAKVAAIKDATANSSTPARDSSVPYVMPPSEEVPQTKEEGMERWKYVMTLRFLRGEDEEFDYRLVDESQELDWVEKRELEEQWFEQEEPDVVVGTGVQDF